MELKLPHRLGQSLFLLVSALQLLLIVLTVFFVKNFKIIENKLGEEHAQLNALGEFEIFMNDWCRVRQARTDIDRLAYLLFFNNTTLFF